ncbi:MAG: UDP-N-acetylmuramoyl-L-alanine--D-glutamate ligase, partial [Cyanobacteria bacterium Co-bin8]|nr:UDP-N-acetylmuramoyl-L-alanine--D-glutamate ligase [Cyanobacteria bacterium Co-bin8]
MQREQVCAVVGLARAGVPTARFLTERGARVIGYDNQPLERLSDDARALRGLGIELRTGDHGFAGLEECDMVVLSPGLKIHHDPLRSVLQQCEARGTEVIGELELAARNCPAPIIAVTGTKGKSTTV